MAVRMKRGDDMMQTKSRRRKSKLFKRNRVLSGTNSVRKNLQKYGKNVRAELDRIAVEIGERVRSMAEQSLRASASPAKRGRPPGMVTGELAGSVRMAKTKKNNVKVGTDVLHGFFQELGTVNSRPRPWLFPALRANKRLYQARLSTLHDRAMRGIDPTGKED